MSNETSNDMPAGLDEPAPARDESSRRRFFAGAALAAAGTAGAAALVEPPDAFASAPSDWYNVKVDYSAKGDGSTDDTTAIQNAINAANSAGGGLVYFPPGTYETGKLTIYSNVYLRGAGVGVSILQLKSGKNDHLIETSGFSTSTTQSHFGIADLTLDGNKAGNSSGGAGLHLYGKSFRVQNVDIYNCNQQGIYSSWQTGGDDMEAHLSSFKIHDCGGSGIDWHGPHDSVFVNFQVFRNGTYGVYDNSGSVLFVNGHVWGAGHTVAWYMDGSGEVLVNCVGEGASDTQLWMHSTDVMAAACRFFCTASGGGNYCVKIGDTSTFVSRCFLDGKLANGPTAAIKVYTGEEALTHIRVQLNPYTSTTPIFEGTPSNTDIVMVMNDDGSVSPGANLVQLPGKIGFFGTAGQAQSTGWSASTSSNKSLTSSSTTAQVRDALGTLISQLKTYGLLGS